MATNGNDYITWNPVNGSILIDGLGDQFDSNLYQPYDLDVGMTTGDMLRVESNQGVFIRFDTWHDGWINQGGNRADFVNVERIYGSSGNDVVRAGQVTQSGPDGHGISIFSGAGNDNIVASRFGDVIDAGSGNDTIFAGMGDDFINSSEGNDLIYGGQGQDNIRWGLGSTFDHDPGNDTIFGGAGSDLINVWNTVGNAWGGKVQGAVVTVHGVIADGSMNLTARVETADGFSVLRAQAFELGWTHEGDDTVSGANANIRGETGFHWGTRWGDDILIGSSGADTLEGGEGADTITSGAGNDLISGNGDYFSWNAPADGDVDTFIFRAGHGADTILAFDSGLDVLDLGGRAYTENVTAEGLLLDFGGGDTIMLANVFEI